MKKILTENLQQKIIALVLAVGVWVYVYTEHHPRFYKVVTAKINYTNIDKTLGIAKGPGEIEIRLKGDPNELASIDISKVTALVNLSHIGEGAHEVPVSVSGTGHASPSSSKLTVAVTLKKLNSIQKTVEVVFSGALPMGKTQGIPKSSPQIVSLYGHESSLLRVESAVASIYLAGQDQNFTINKQVVAIDSSGSPVKGIKSDPEYVSITVPVYNASARTKSVMPVYSGRLSGPDKNVILEIDPPTVTVFGDEKSLESVNMIRTEQFDAARCLRGETFRTKLATPKSLVASPSEVIIRCRVPEIVPREFTVNVNVHNLARGLLADVFPEKIDIIASGESTVMNKLGLADFTAKIDLEGRGPGTYNLTPEVTMNPASSHGVKLGNIPQIRVAVTRK